MGQFDLLSHVGRVLQSVIEDNVQAGTEVRIAAPLEDAGGAGRAVRITLMWTTPQPTHRNDPPERNPDGTIALPPPTLSLFYLVTTHGSTPEGDALEAHDLLGRILRAFHVQQQLELPVAGLGDGRISVLQQPMEAEMVEKLFTPLHVNLRPWAVFEVAPVQLVRAPEPVIPAPLVRPGGVNLASLEVLRPPRIERVTPASVGEGGRIRIDAAYAGDPLRVTVGTERIEPPEIAALAAGGPVHVNLPPAITATAYDVTLAALNDIASRPANLTVLPAGAPSVFAPNTLDHSAAGDLVLEGASLGADGDALSVFFWPDGGIAAPADVVELNGTVEGGGGALRVTPAELAALRPTQYRLSVQVAPHLYTPFVLLEVTP